MSSMRLHTHGCSSTWGGQVGQRPADRSANRPCLEGLGFAHGRVDRARPHRDLEPPLRDSAGISPDFAPTVRARRYTAEATTHAASNRLAALMADEQTPTTDALEDDPRPDGLRSATSLGPRQHRQREGQEFVGVRDDAACARRRLARSPSIQFVKSGDWKVGEELMGRKLGVRLAHVRRRVHLGLGRTWTNDKAHAERGLGRRPSGSSRPATTGWSSSTSSPTSAPGAGSTRPTSSPRSPDDPNT